MMKVTKEWEQWLQQVIPEQYTCQMIYRLYSAVLHQEYHEPFGCFRHGKRLFITTDLSPFALVFEEYRQIGVFLDAVEARYCHGMSVEDCYHQEST